MGHLDVSGGLEAVQLVEQLEHRPLHLAAGCPRSKSQEHATPSSLSGHTCFAGRKRPPTDADMLQRMQAAAFAGPLANGGEGARTFTARFHNGHLGRYLERAPGGVVAAGGIAQGRGRRRGDEADHRERIRNRREEKGDKRGEDRGEGRGSLSLGCAHLGVTAALTIPAGLADRVDLVLKGPTKVKVKDNATGAPQKSQP